MATQGEPRRRRADGAERELLAALGVGERETPRFLGALRSAVEVMAAPAGTAGAVDDAGLLAALTASGGWPAAPGPDGRPGADTGTAGPARVLGRLVAAAAADARIAERGAERELYDEACAVRDTWGELVMGADPDDSGPHGDDAGYADRALDDFRDAGTFRWTDACVLTRQLGEALARDGAGAPLEFDGYGRPALGWPALFGHLALGLRGIAGAAVAGGAAPARVEPGARQARPPEPGPYGLARWLLGAYDGTPGSPTGLHRIRRSMPWQLLTMARRQLEELRAGPADLAREADEVCRQLTGTGAPPLPDGDELAYSAWELHTLFPVLPGLVAFDRATGPGAAREGEAAYDGGTRVAFVVAGHLDRIGARSRAACALAGELAALDLLFARDDDLHQALAALGSGPPRGADPEVAPWDTLTWRSWLREAGAALHHEIRNAGRRLP